MARGLMVYPMGGTIDGKTGDHVLLAPPFIVTDRDIVVRADASAMPLDTTQVGEICTDGLVKLTPAASLDEAVKVMRQYAIRRVPVVREGQAVGIVSIGDLARCQDPDSALAQISSAAPNN